MYISEKEEAKIEKLPLWAKQLISNLRGRIKKQSEELSMLGGSPTKISYGNKDVDEVVHYIPEDITIEFKVGPLNRDEFRVHLDKNTLKKSCLYVSGIGGIRVYPVASNVVRIEIED